MSDEPGIKWKLDDSITGSVLDAQWMDLYAGNIAFIRDRRGPDILADKDVVDLFKPTIKICPETYNEIMGLPSGTCQEASSQVG